MLYVYKTEVKDHQINLRELGWGNKLKDNSMILIKRGEQAFFRCTYDDQDRETYRSAGMEMEDDRIIGVPLGDGPCEIIVDMSDIAEDITGLIRSWPRRREWLRAMPKRIHAETELIPPNQLEEKV